MHTTVDLTIEPNEKYHRAVGLYHPEHPDADLGEEPYEDWPEEHQQAADGYVETVESAPTPEEIDLDMSEVPELSWDDISPASDPDLLSKIATYFDGMSPDEPTDRLRAKCRLLYVEVYSNAQIAAQAELRS